MIIKGKVQSRLMGLFVTLAIFSLLYIGFKDQLSEISLEQVKALLVSIPVEVYFIYLSLLMLFFLLRSWRYQLLIEQGENKSTFSKAKLFLTTIARGILVDLLPARSGEAGFIGILKYYCAVDFRTGLSVVLISILFDLVSLIIVAILVYLILVNQLLLWGLFLFVVITAVVLVVVLDFSALVRKAIFIFNHDQTTSSFFQSLGKLLEKLLKITAYTIRRKVLFKILSLSILMRIIRLLSLVVLLNAILSYALLDENNLTGIELFATVTASEVSGSIPIPSFLGFGLWESGGVVMAQFIAKANSIILVALLSVHLFTKVVGSLVSGLALIVILVSGFRKGGVS